MEEGSLPVRVVSADELGQLKVAQSNGSQLSSTAVVAKWGQPARQQAIDCMALGSAAGITDTATAMLAVARASGVIELLNPLTGMQHSSVSPAISNNNGSDSSAGDARLAGLHLLWGMGSSADDVPSSSTSAGGLPALLAVTQGGCARLLSWSAPAAAPEADDDSSLTNAWQDVRSWSTPAQVCCTAYAASSSSGGGGTGSRGGTLAVGCQGSELRLFDVATGQLAWAAKGGKPNMVGLVDKPWNTALAFLPSLPSSSSSNGSAEGGAEAGACSSRLLVGTGYHKVRLYDAAAGKRPQMDLSWGEARISALAVEPVGQRCWVANAAGQIEALDLRTRRFVGGVKGIAGSVRSLALHPAAPVLASVGLDRYLRLHSTASRALLAKVYLKTQLTAVAFCPTDASMLPAPKAAQAQGQGEQAEEGEAEHEEGGAAGSEGRSRRRKSGSGSGSGSGKRDKRQKKPRRQQPSHDSD